MVMKIEHMSTQPKADICLYAYGGFTSRLEEGSLMRIMSSVGILPGGVGTPKKCTLTHCPRCIEMMSLEA